MRFADYLATTGKGNIDKKRLAVRSCVVSLERLFAGFERKTSAIIELQVRLEVLRVSIPSTRFCCANSELLQYIKNQLVADGKLSTARREKHLFSVKEYERYIHTLWSHPENHLEHPRETCNNSFLLGNFATLGARIGGLLPKCSKDKHPGIRYKVALIHSNSDLAKCYL